MRQKVIFETKDGVQIVGDYLEAAKGAPTALLLHMMPAMRMSWYPFMAKLSEAGFNSLAIDFRGHGDSLRGRTSTPSAAPHFRSKVGGERRRFDLDNGFKALDYKKFSDAEQQAKILDVRAAVGWLKKRGQTLIAPEALPIGPEAPKVLRARPVLRAPERFDFDLVLVGASIGANLALQYMTQDPEVRRGVLLSPGLDYRGIKADLLIKKLAPDQRVLFVASRDDEYSFKTVKELNHLVPKNSELWEFSNLGHGTAMVERDPDLITKIINWL